MKPAHVKNNTYINIGKEMNDKSPKVKVSGHVSYTKSYTPNWSEETFSMKKVKNAVPWTYVINDLNGEEIIGTFYGKEFQKTNQQEFRIEKVMKIYIFILCQMQRI